MGKANYSDDFKRDAVHQITVRGYPVREVSQRLGVSTHSGPVAELFRSFDLVFCHKGETSWHRDQPLNSAQRLCGWPSGFYAWLKAPFSKRAAEDQRQTELIKEAWKESGKVYGYRKLHDDLLDQGETCSANRVARLARLAGIKARIGYKRRPGTGAHPAQNIQN